MLRGGNGDDWLYGGKPAYLPLEAKYSHTGLDTYFGGDGIDIVSYAEERIFPWSGGPTLVVTIGGTATIYDDFDNKTGVTEFIPDDIEGIEGTSGRDWITGNAGDNILIGGAGRIC